MLEQAIPASAATALALGALVLSNVLYDRGSDRGVSRSLASFLGGLAFLVTVLWMSVWPAVALAGVMAGLVLGLRLWRRGDLRGSDGQLRGQMWAQVTYPIMGVVSLAVGWGGLGDRWLGFLPIAFVAWGDAAAGLARATVWQGRTGSLWPSIVMLMACLVVAVAYSPYWIGAIGALVATVAERKRPNMVALWDDNVNVVVASIAVMIALLGVVG